ncbi:MAG TPA: YggS family pyridoxal phosphate-dependent enzyme [Ktedonobacteraceae bacterium]|nr:YggS family pyridoxal phosphate-dependent enzyme [Ktedonobacteraceae bacterium]
MINHDTDNQLQILSENLTHIRTRIAEAAQRAGRSPDEITLVAVSKTKPLELVKMAYTLGVTDFGENRVQEAQTKIAAFQPQGLRWHMIGHVQTNKANKVVSIFDSVQSVDSLHLAQALSQQASQQGKRLTVLLEINVAGETSKTGIPLAEASTVAQQVVALPGLDVAGLMTVAPLVENPEEVRPVFRTLRELRARLQEEVPQSRWEQLSMGMTDDYPVAIEEGATIVRIGRAIFGERVQKQ